MSNTTPLHGDKLCSLKETRALVGNPATSTLYRWIEQGRFPRQRRIGVNRVGWLYSEIQNFVSQCEAA